jgi:glycosyltransferase involved in cell wall biosynthesis
MNNARGFVADALNSILTQTYRDLEVIVVDDGSTDGSAQYVRDTFGGRCTLLQQQRRGPAAARNLGIRRARGEYVAFLDADDLWLPKKIEVQVATFIRRRDWGMVYGEYEKARGREEITGVVGSVGDAGPARSRDTPFEHLLLRCPAHTSTVVLRRSALEAVGLFRHDLITGEDLDLWWRIALRFSVGRVCAKVAVVREHPSQTTKVVRTESGAVKALLALEEEGSLTVPQRRSVERAIGYHCVRKAGELVHQGKRREARRYFLLGARYGTLSVRGIRHALVSLVPPSAVSWLRMHIYRR